MTRGQHFEKKGNGKKHSSALSNSPRCNSNSKGDILKVHDMCTNQRCKGQKQITFTPKQFQLEGAGFENFYKKSFLEERRQLGLIF